jgi:hypothetical protein
MPAHEVGAMAAIARADIDGFSVRGQRFGNGLMIGDTSRGRRRNGRDALRRRQQRGGELQRRAAAKPLGRDALHAAMANNDNPGHELGPYIAARLEAIAEPGGICISEDACRQVRDKIDTGFNDLVDKELKNIARPVRVYWVAAATAAALALPDKPSIAVLPSYIRDASTAQRKRTGSGTSLLR